MIAAHSLLRGDVAEYVTLLLIASSHACWMRSALLRYKLLEFFSSLLEVGFDDPDVGVVLQHKAPQSAAAFLQRKGRGGRKQSMRPWTVVVLSDYGRDRIAYQSYDQLFSPNLPARQLALHNRAVLRMQATYALCDWLARRLPPDEQPDPWNDFSRPATEIENATVAADVGRRQALYVEYLWALLEQSSVLEEFTYFLRRSLAVGEEEATALLWEPPRALVTETIPTLLRRLERGWRRIDGVGMEQHTARVPLPEFVPRTLFSDLQLPEVTVRIPAQGRAPARTESMAVAQALREFAPGRVSRRCGVSSGRERYWIAPGNGPQLMIDSFCPIRDRQELGRFRYVASDGIEREILVFRPHAIDVTLTPLSVQQSSNSFLDWHTEIVPTNEGYSVDLPQGHRWLSLLRSFSIHSHHLGSPVEIRRFAVGAVASVGWGPGQQVRQSIQFGSTIGDTNAPAAIGFVGDHDAVQIRFEYPTRLHELCRQDRQLVRGLRVARFRWLVQTTPALNGLANGFQREWLAQVYLSVVTATALRESISLSEAEVAVHRGTSSTTIREVLETILQWGGGDFDDVDQVRDDAIPRRLRELRDLFGRAEVLEALHQNARVLWEEMSEEWEGWLRTRFKATLGAALLDAAQTLAPQIGGGSLLLDLELSVRRPQVETCSSNGNVDEIWLTESSVGGGGFVEDFLKQYVRDPRRYFRLLEGSLAASDLESVSEEVARILAIVASDEPDAALVASAFRAVREAESHGGSLSALSRLRAAMSRNHVQPSPTLLISLSTRVLRPGTNADSDRFVARCLREWTEAEGSLGIDVDARVFSLVKSSDSELERVLRVEEAIGEGPDVISWRFGVLYGMLWPRGAQVRSESLRAWNPFRQPPECDRLLVLAVVPRSTRRVSLSSPRWFQDLANLIVQDGTVELICRYEESAQLANALLRIGTELVDSEALLVHARVSGISRETDWIVAEVELPEVLQ